jgi:hypothetical protein
MPRRRTLTALGLCAALLAPAGAHAKASKADRLWATVNLCDTASAPNTIGIRASMPGYAHGQRMYMRFEAQYWDAARKRFVSTGSTSRWLRVGSGTKTAQTGFNFFFAPPPAGEQFVMRGRVDYRWTAKRKGRYRVVRTGKRITHAGRRDVDGGDPPGTSQSVCVIT